MQRSLEILEFGSEHIWSIFSEGLKDGPPEEVIPTMVPTMMARNRINIK